MNTEFWNYILTFVGVAGFLITGYFKQWWGWYVNIANQALWFGYSWATDQWGFFVGAIVYTIAFSLNAYRATRDHARLVGWERWKKKLPDQMLKPLGTIGTIETGPDGMKVHGTIYDTMAVKNLEGGRLDDLKVRLDFDSTKFMDGIKEATPSIPPVRVHGSGPGKNVFRCDFRTRFGEHDEDLFCIRGKHKDGRHLLELPGEGAGTLEWPFEEEFDFNKVAMPDGSVFGPGSDRPISPMGFGRTYKNVFQDPPERTYDFSNISMEDIREIWEEFRAELAGEEKYEGKRKKVEE